MTAVDFKILHDLTVELWPDASARPALFGPDPHSLHGPTTTTTSGDQQQQQQLDWIRDWLALTKAAGTPVAGVTHHE